MLCGSVEVILMVAEETKQVSESHEISLESIHEQTLALETWVLIVNNRQYTITSTIGETHCDTLTWFKVLGLCFSLFPFFFLSFLCSFLPPPLKLIRELP